MLIVLQLATLAIVAYMAINLQTLRSIMLNVEKLITEVKNATDALAIRVQALVDAGSSGALTDAQQAEGQAIIDTLNALGASKTNPVPPPITPA